MIKKFLLLAAFMIGTIASLAQDEPQINAVVADDSDAFQILRNVIDSPRLFSLQENLTLRLLDPNDVAKGGDWQYILIGNLFAGNARIDAGDAARIKNHLQQATISQVDYRDHQKRRMGERWRTFWLSHPNTPERFLMCVLAPENWVVFFRPIYKESFLTELPFAPSATFLGIMESAEVVSILMDFASEVD